MSLSQLKHIVFPTTSLQEQSEGRSVLCGTVVLDKGSEGLQQQVSNKVYERCRADGGWEVPNFPDYKPLITALQASQPDESTETYHVTVKRHDKLVILSSLANKFLESTDFKDECATLITEHNAVFNQDGDYMADPEPTRTL